MRPRLLLALAALFLTLAVYFYRNFAPPPELVAGPETREGSPSRALHKPERVPVPRNTTDPGSTLSSQLEEEIEAAVVTYSPEALPVFEKLLASGEPDVRESARDGLVRLGEKGGAALLRRASARLTDPEEIKRFLETAEHLELPSASEGPFKK